MQCSFLVETPLLVLTVQMTSDLMKCGPALVLFQVDPKLGKQTLLLSTYKQILLQPSCPPDRSHFTPHFFGIQILGFTRHSFPHLRLALTHVSESLASMRSSQALPVSWSCIYRDWERANALLFLVLMQVSQSRTVLVALLTSSPLLPED